MVTGTIILVIGISLMRVGINWAGGGLPMFTKVVNGEVVQVANPNYGALPGLGLSLFVMLVILALIKWGKGFLANVAVLLGIVAGAVVAAVLGIMHFDKVASARWVDVVLPLHFGVPQFHLVPVVTMCIVMVVVMIESLGMFLALSDMTGKPWTRRPWRAACGRMASAPCWAAVQHLPLHLLLAERGPGGRDRRALALGDGGGRRHHASAGAFA